MVNWFTNSVNNFFGADLKAAPSQSTPAQANPSSENAIGDVLNRTVDNSIFKAYMPEYLYNPPFGYPRSLNITLVRQLSRNPYIYSVVRTLCDEVASTDWEIAPREGVELTPQLEETRKRIANFLQNPNRNKESFADIMRAVARDMLELDSGVIVKVFNRKGELTQLFARDGGFFLKNPDIYGYMGERADFVMPMNLDLNAKPDSPEYVQQLQKYQMVYKHTAAYFQYGSGPIAFPVPFGNREIVYFSMNPHTNSIYGISPVQILGDVIMTLVYGANYNLDFYMNNNMPEGIITLVGSNKDQQEAFRQRMDSVTRIKDAATGFMRRIGFKIPVVSTPATFTPFQLDPKTMQVIEQQQWFTKVVWMCFGVTADEMGFTETSNKTNGEEQTKLSKRKAVRPLLTAIKYRLDNEIIAEFGQEAYDSFEFKWDEYDIDEAMKERNLQQLEINMGIKTPEMVADECGIDYAKVKETKETLLEDTQKHTDASVPTHEKEAAKDEKKEEKANVKSEQFESELEKELVTQVRSRGQEILKRLDAEESGALKNIQ
jgi:phage portal protein BeeE